MTSLLILWQRLVDSHGQTCPRCGTTYEELKTAVAKLQEAFLPLGIEVVFEIRELSMESFMAGPSQSNRIWIAGKPLESWLEAEITGSPCCSVCGDNDCRAIKIGASEFEAVPANLVIKAALIAASQLVESSEPNKSDCCSG